MKGLVLLSALMVLAASGADAQRRGAGGGPRNPIPSGGGQTAGSSGHVGDPGHRDHGRKRGGDVWLIENEVVEVVQVEKEARPAEAAVAPAAASVPEPKKREPYKIGNSYDSLPGSCMKLIQDGASYFLCSGEWYQEVGKGQYKAVTQP